jgi:hypothetical protein
MRSCSIVIAAFLVGSAGCGTRVETTVELEPAQLKLSQVGQAYSQAIQKLKRGPRDLEELRPFLLTMPNGDATADAIANRSIVVIWNLGRADLAMKSAPDAPPQYPVLAYFTAKEGNIRFVLTKTSHIEEMTDEQFRKAYFPKGHKPAV